MTPEEEAAVRADERLKVLREVRNAAMKIEHQPGQDPYLWGHGGRQIIGMINRRLNEQRIRMGIPMPQQRKGDHDG